jgi:hypothetical protein
MFAIVQAVQHETAISSDREVTSCFLKITQLQNGLPVATRAVGQRGTTIDHGESKNKVVEGAGPSFHALRSVARRRDWTSFLFHSTACQVGETAAAISYDPASRPSV